MGGKRGYAIPFGILPVPLGVESVVAPRLRFFLVNRPLDAGHMRSPCTKQREVPRPANVEGRRCEGWATCATA
jgi:hypothetical protein